ncbi:MAG: BREX-1 system phosphatase PglZ type A [Anaerostipes sp.]|jgi:uncharacterized protein (TIGR02687 family)
MDIQNIQEQLNTEFSKQGVRLVFWFDDKGEYEDEVSEIHLDNASLHVLDGMNWLQTKWLLNESDPDGKYLIYAPFSKPSDAKNPLADMYYYSVPYYTDRISQMSQEIGIDNRFKEHLAKYRNFWKNTKRIDSFKNLNIDYYTTEEIDIGLLATLVDVKTPSFEEIIKQMLMKEEKEYLKAITTNDLQDTFWELCEKYFGYASDKPSIEDMSACMVVTYAAASLKSSLPATMTSYVLKKRNDVVVFVRNLMDNVIYQETYDALAKKIDTTLRFVKRVEESASQLEDIVECDAFKGLDQIIINWITDKLNNEILDAEIAGMNIAGVCEQRMSKAFHFGSAYVHEYTALKYAYLLMKAIINMDASRELLEMVNQYKKETYLIDSYYRWFYHAYDQISDSELFGELRERIENIYSNVYLHKMIPSWNEALPEITSQSDVVLQQNFYHQYLQAYEGKERVIVIISDALRYECAKELMGRFELDEKCEARIDSMIGMLPSVTFLGMASLLPHKELDFDESLNVTVDGISCGDLASRDKILKNRNSDNVAVSFDDIAKANKTTIRELLQGKNVVYVYHNQVDARGDKAASENEVFNACDEAIDEILKLVKKLTSNISATKYIITADHGFLYKRDKLQEFDKVSYPKETCTYTNKRFLITTEAINEQGFVSRTMTYMNKTNSLYVTTPIGADIFKVAGGGQNYVHGGSSIQEMLVPVVEVKTAKGKMNTDFVDVILTSVNRKVTNLTTFFDFIQTEKVTDVMKARSIIAYFATEDGEKISFDVPIVANCREDAPEKRTFHEKFTFKTRKYQRGDKYYLCLVDANDEKNVLQRYEFTIDIAFVDDFGF